MMTRNLNIRAGLAVSLLISICCDARADTPMGIWPIGKFERDAAFGFVGLLKIPVTRLGHAAQRNYAIKSSDGQTMARLAFASRNDGEVGLSIKVSGKKRVRVAGYCFVDNIHELRSDTIFSWEFVDRNGKGWALHFPLLSREKIRLKSADRPCDAFEQDASLL